MYFSLQTLATIGYGDIVPANKYEMLFVMTIMVLASALFAYIVGYIGQVID